MSEETTESRAEPPYKVGDTVLVEATITQILPSGNVRVRYRYADVTDFNNYKVEEIHSLAPKEPVKRRIISSTPYREEKNGMVTMGFTMVTEKVEGDIESATTEKVVRFSEEEYKNLMWNISEVIGFLYGSNLDDPDNVVDNFLKDLRKKLMGAEW